VGDGEEDLRVVGDECVLGDLVLDPGAEAVRQRVELEIDPAPAGFCAPLSAAGMEFCSGAAAESGALPADESVEPAVEDVGTASLAGTAPPLRVSSETELPPEVVDVMLRMVSRVKSTALVSAGGVRVGWPTLAASLTSGCLRKFPIILPNRPVSERLASSALLSAMACGV